MSSKGKGTEVGAQNEKEEGGGAVLGAGGGVKAGPAPAWDPNLPHTDSH